MTETTTPDWVQQLQQLWERYSKALGEFQNELQDIQEQELDVTACESYLTAFDRIRLRDRELSEVREHAVWHLVRQASHEFAPSGGRLNIDHDDYAAWYKTPNEDLDLPALWAQLEADYGGDTGEQVAHTQTANALIDGFRIRRDEAIKTVKGCPVLNHPIRLDDLSRKHERVDRLDTCSGMELDKSMIALREFAVWTGDTAFISACNGLYSPSQLPITSRERILDTEQLRITMFKSKVEFRFSKAIGEQLQLFLGQYGTKFW